MRITRAGVAEEQMETQFDLCRNSVYCGYGRSKETYSTKQKANVGFSVGIVYIYTWSKGVYKDAD